MSLNILERFPLKDLTTYKTGGEARYFASPTDEQEVLDYVSFSQKAKMPLIVIGGGSNVLIADGLLDACVMSSLMLNAIDILDETDQYVTISAGAGVSTKVLLAFCLEHSLTGAEFLTGIPGTLGGALYGNAGAQGETIEPIFRSARVVTKDLKVNNVARDKLTFSYRKLAWLEEPVCILSMVLSMQKTEIESVRQKIAHFAACKKGQPIGAKTAGCVFKNPGNGISAGKLIDQMGGKDLQVGGAAVSHCHANFIENKANATSTDIYNLVCLIKQKIQKTFGITLENEIKFLGKF